MTDATIPTDVDYSDDGAIDAFLALADDDAKKRPSEGEVEAPETREATPAETEDNTEEGESEETETSTDPDDQEVEVKVGEEAKKTTLRELKRLYGQEAALTQKSQKASEQLREAETQSQRAVATSKAILERAQTRFKPYAELDWLVLSQRMADQPEAFQQLRQDALEAKADVDFLTQEVGGFMQKQTEAAQKAHREAATECIRVLSDPQTGIKDFGKPVYDEMVAFAAEQGLPNVRTSTSPAEYHILYMAMQWAKAQAATKAAEDKVEKVKTPAPKRVLKPGSGKGSSDTKRAALDALRRTGDDDDALAAFMAL